MEDKPITGSGQQEAVPVTPFAQTTPTPQPQPIAQQPTSSYPNAPRQNPAESKARNVFRTYYLVYYIFGLLEILLSFRFIFMLLGASSASSFVAFIYSLTAVFVAPFSGIFQTTVTQVSTASSIFDPAILVAMLVYALIGWGLAHLFHVIATGRKPEA